MELGSTILFGTLDMLGIVSILIFMDITHTDTILTDIIDTETIIIDTEEEIQHTTASTEEILCTQETIGIQQQETIEER